MSDGAQVLRSQLSISVEDFLSLQLDELKDHVVNNLVVGLLQAITQCDAILLTEEADVENVAKVYTAEVIVLSPEEYERLKKIELAHKLDAMENNEDGGTL